MPKPEHIIIIIATDWACVCNFLSQSVAFGSRKNQWCSETSEIWQLSIHFNICILFSKNVYIGI